MSNTSIEIELLMRNSTRKGLQAAESNITDYQRMTEAIIKRLEGDIAQMQSRLSKGLDMNSFVKESAKVEALTAEVEKLKRVIEELDKRKPNSAPLLPEDPVVTKKKFDGLSFSFQQMARELPALTMGPQMFFLAISNNLPIFTDQIALARKEYEALIASGQKATPVWKQVAKSMFSWQTAMMVGISLLIVYGKEISNWISEVFKAKSAAKDFVNAEQEMALARKSAISDSAKERIELNLLYNKLKDATISTRERSAAVSEWTKKYPQHSNIMNGELVSLEKLNSAYQSLSKQIIEAAKARTYADKITKLETKKNDTLTKRQNQYVTYLKAIEEQNKAVEEYNKKEKTGFGTATAKIAAKDKIFRAEQNVAAQKKAWEDLIKETKAYDESISIISKKIKVDDLFLQPKEGTYDYWQQQVKNADAALKQIDSKQKVMLDNAAKTSKTDLYSLGIDKSTVDSYKNAIKAKKEAEKELKAYPTASQENKELATVESLRVRKEKYNLLLDEQTRKRVRAEEDAANELAQAEIDADKDGAEKVLKQRKLNHDKEIQAIVREADDRKQAVIDAGRTAFEAAEDLAKAKNPKYIKKTFDKEKFEKSERAQKEILQINKVAQDKVDAENAKYNRGDDLKDLIDRYQSFADQRLTIEKKFNEDIKVLDAQRKTALENGDMEQVAKIDRSKIQAEKKKKEDLSGVTMNEFKADIDWTTLFGNLDVLSPEALNKLRDKLKAFIETAAGKLTPEDLKVLSEAMTNVGLTIADKTSYEALKLGLSGYKAATEDASKAQERLNKLEKEGKGGTKEYKDATKGLTDAQRRRAESLKTITQATNNIGEKGQQVVQAGSDICDMLTSLGVSIPESLTGALNGVGQVMDSLASIDLMKPMSIVTGITGTLAGIGKTIGSIFGGKGNKTLKDTKRLEATTKRLAETEKVINSFIEKRIELLKAANIAEQKNISATTQKAIDNQKKYYEQQLQGLKGNWLLAKKGKNNNLTLEDLGIGSIKELEEFLSSERLLELQKNGYSIRDAEQWQAIIDGNNSVLDKEKELQEIMSKNRTGMSLDDATSALDEFVRNADTSFEDVSDSFEDHMRNAMFNIVKQNYLNKALEDWYKDLEKAMSDGELDETEAKESKKKYEDAYANAQNRYDTALKAAGISPEDITKQSGRAGAFTTMTQDQGTKLEGLFTSVQDHTSSLDDTCKEVSGSLQKSSETLTKIEENTRRTADGIETIIRDGLKMK